MLPLGRRGTAGFAMVLFGLAHLTDWPFPRGGAQALADALAARLREGAGRSGPATPWRRSPSCRPAVPSCAT
jgi:hypothetical protein